MKFSICLPTYKGAHVLGMALEGIFNQDYQNFEILIGDDNPPDALEHRQATQEVVARFDASRIHYIANERNLGYAVNLKNLVEQASGEIIYLFAQDDILAKGALRKTYEAFARDPDVGVVTRPYFWFMEDISRPVRAVTPYDSERDAVLSLKDGKKAFLKIFESVGQLSGLAYRRAFLEVPFHEDVFPAHIYPFAGILRKHKCVFLKDYVVAIGIVESQTRFVSGIYDRSPTQSWLDMYDTVFAGPDYAEARQWGYEHICTNFMGLVQLRNYARPGVLEREIALLARRWPRVLVNPRFWFFALGARLTPRTLLRYLVDHYKSTIHATGLSSISFEPATTTCNPQ